MKIELKDNIKKYLIKVAKQKISFDPDSEVEFYPEKHFDYDAEKAYWIGIEDGEQMMAKYVLIAFGIKYK